MCGVFGVYGIENASTLVFPGLVALNHRGQESCGITSSDGNEIYHHKDMGLVTQVYPAQEQKRIFDELKGHIAAGQDRYSTTGGSKRKNVQPLIHPAEGYGHSPEMTISHNGNIPNARKIRDALEKTGAKFYTNTDTEIYFKRFESAKGGLEERVIEAFSKDPGSFSAIVTTKDTLIAMKDPWGNRPLCYGTLNGGYVFASESCAIDAVGGNYERELNPGEMAVIGKEGILKMHQAFEPKQKQSCVFEHVYFLRPDSLFFGLPNGAIQENMGRRLWVEAGIEADMICAVPNSARKCAEGMSKASGIWCEEAIMKNPYVHRTFIEPGQRAREKAVRAKFNPIRYYTEGKKIVLVDDSLIRATTTRALIYVLKEYGKAKEVHVRISSPWYKHPCYYGIDTADKSELIAHRKNNEEIREFIGATTLAYLSLDGLLDSCPDKKENYCTACFNGDYQIPLNGLIAA